MIKSYFILFIIFLLPITLKAELVIDITEGNIEPIPVAILDFDAKESDVRKISNDINKVINSNLERSEICWLDLTRLTSRRLTQR